MQPELIATQTAALSDLTLKFSSRGRTIFRKIRVLGHPVSLSAILITLRLKHIPLTDTPASITSEIRATQVRRMNRQSHFCRISAAFRPHFSRISVAEVRLMNLAWAMISRSEYCYYMCKLHADETK